MVTKVTTTKVYIFKSTNTSTLAADINNWLANTTNYTTLISVQCWSTIMDNKPLHFACIYYTVTV